MRTYSCSHAACSAPVRNGSAAGTGCHAALQRRRDEVDLFLDGVAERGERAPEPLLEHRPPGCVGLQNAHVAAARAESQRLHFARERALARQAVGDRDLQDRNTAVRRDRLRDVTATAPRTGLADADAPLRFEPRNDRRQFGEPARAFGTDGFRFAPDRIRYTDRRAQKPSCPNIIIHWSLERGRKT